MENRFYETKDIEKLSDFLQKQLQNNQILFFTTKDAEDVIKKEKFFEVTGIKSFNIINYLSNNYTEGRGPLKGIKRRSLRFRGNRWLICNIKSDFHLKTTTNETIKLFISQRIDRTKNWFYLLYFIIVIVLTGLVFSFLGLLSTINTSYAFDLNSIGDALVGYSIVLLTTSAIELIMFSPKKDGDEKAFIRIKKSIKMIGIASLISVLILTIIVYILKIDWLKTLYGTTITFFSISLWYIANATNLNSKEEEETKTIDDTTGGKESANFNDSQNEIPEGYNI
jgi:hypothetical protein